MDYSQIFALAILLIFLILQIGRRPWQINFFFWAKIGFWGSLAGAVLYYGYLVYNQYFIWFIGGPPTIYLLPPYESIGYVFSYHFIRFGLGYSISLLAAVLFLAAAVWHNRRHQEKFFEKEEPYLGALAIFLAGTPGGLFYFGGLIFVYFIFHLGLGLVRRPEKEFRLPLYWLWLPLAILVIMKEIIFR